MSDATATQATAEVASQKTEGAPAPEAQAKAPEAQATAAGTGDTTTTEASTKAEASGDLKSEVPEKYELKAPDGSAITPEQVEKIALYAKEHGLSNKEAQAMVERDHMLVSDHQKMVAQWKSDVLSDPELGGDNAKEKVELAHRAFKHFASEKFAQELVATGYGDHPELVRVFYKVGKMIGEDKFVVPGANNGTTMSLEDKFYGNIG